MGLRVVDMLEAGSLILDLARVPPHPMSSKREKSSDFRTYSTGFSVVAGAMILYCLSGALAEV
jgi:hypothetical protein